MTFNHSMIFTTWYPFDASVSPIYEMVNLSQVKCTILLTSCKYSSRDDTYVTRSVCDYQLSIKHTWNVWDCPHVRCWMYDTVSV
jgi:hypothetical protein